MLSRERALIPDFNLDGVLPPFIGSTPGGQIAQASPFECTPLEIVERFSTTPHRVKLLEGFFAFRAALRAKGIDCGFQWLDGSFTENVEANGRDPNDIDVVTLLYRPHGLEEPRTWQAVFNAEKTGGIFDRALNKAAFTCDTFFIDLNIPPHLIARQSAYWIGLFSHRRDTFQWKGMLTVPLATDDSDAIARLRS